MTNSMIRRAGLQLWGVLCIPLLLAVGCADEPSPPQFFLPAHCSDAMLFFANGSADLSEDETTRLMAYVSDKPCSLNPDPRRNDVFLVVGYTVQTNNAEPQNRLVVIQRRISKSCDM